jgi:hypothetical protein
MFGAKDNGVLCIGINLHQSQNIQDMYIIKCILETQSIVPAVNPIKGSVPGTLTADEIINPYFFNAY